MIAALLLAAAAVHPCMEDAQKLCPGIQAGGGRIAACLKAHQAGLGAACKEKIGEFREEAQSCEADVQRLCPNTKPGPDRQQCMRQHKDEVSAECKEFFAKRMEGREGARDAMAACKDDAQKLCARVKPGQGRIVECLRQHDTELSQGCAAVLKK